MLCLYAECQILFIVVLSVFMPRAIMLNVIMPSVIMPSVIMLNVAILIMVQATFSTSNVRLDQKTLKDVINFWNTKITFNFDVSGVQKVDEMSRNWRGKLMKCQVDKMASW